MTTVRMSREELTAAALKTPHDFQRARIAQMLQKNWKVYGTRSIYEGGKEITLVFMSFEQGCFGVVYPNGLFDRNKAGRKTIDFSWKRARDLADATIPAHGVPVLQDA